MKFNRKRKHKHKITNHEGALAYKISPEMELYTSVVTASLSNTFYEAANDRLERIQGLITQVRPEFVAKLAVYAREKMYLRSVPLVLTTELAKRHRGDSLVSKLTSRVIQRADEITELLAYYQYANHREGMKKLDRLSKQLQRGIAQAFNKFDEYQFAKYNRRTEVRLKDALFLTHPKAKDENQQALFDKIANDQLEVPYTWEVELSALGKVKYKNDLEKKRAFKAKWEELIDSKRVGYMALMRNLRNILQAEVSADHMYKVMEYLTNEQAVRKSKQLPIRFLAAYRELEHLKLPFTSFVLDALEQAVQHSTQNIKGFDLKTRILLAADVSASMFTAISPKSKIRCYDIGLLLSMLMRQKSDNVVTGIFGDRWMQKNFAKGNILANVKKLDKIQGLVGYSTNGHLVIEELIKKRRVMDKVMFFTDLQMWNTRGDGKSLKKSWEIYKSQIAPEAKLYLFDLMGYGHSPLNAQRNDVYLIGGWSNKIFDVLTAIENGENALKEVKKVVV